jgi:hypothetical protein
MPLGRAWRGRCEAAHHVPTFKELREWCNLGYPAGCRWCPQDRKADKISFLATRDCGSRVQVSYVLERDHRPVGHGTLQYDTEASRWLTAPESTALAHQADAYICAYLEQRQQATQQLAIDYELVVSAE